MSRSRKKTKIHGITTAVSEKKDKQEANRKYRRIVNQLVNSKLTATQLVNLPNIKEVSNVWTFSKDGKTFNSNMMEKDMRK